MSFPLPSLIFFFFKRIDDFISTFPMKGAFSLLAVSSPGEVYDQVEENAFLLLPASAVGLWVRDGT